MLVPYNNNAAYKKPIKIWDVNVDNIVISKLVKKQKLILSI